jgi:hypothetical protein
VPPRAEPLVAFAECRRHQTRPQGRSARYVQTALLRTSSSSRPRKPATAAFVMPRSSASFRNSTSESVHDVPAFGWELAALADLERSFVQKIVVVW